MFPAAGVVHHSCSASSQKQAQLLGCLQPSIDGPSNIPSSSSYSPSPPFAHPSSLHLLQKEHPTAFVHSPLLQKQQQQQRSHQFNVGPSSSSSLPSAAAVDQEAIRSPARPSQHLVILDGPSSSPSSSSGHPHPCINLANSSSADSLPSVSSSSFICHRRKTAKEEGEGAERMLTFLRGNDNNDYYEEKVDEGGKVGGEKKEKNDQRKCDEDEQSNGRIVTTKMKKENNGHKMDDFPKNDETAGGEPKAQIQEQIKVNEEHPLHKIAITPSIRAPPNNRISHKIIIGTGEDSASLMLQFLILLTSSSLLFLLDGKSSSFHEI
jgi:hypothetical protein